MIFEENILKNSSIEMGDNPASRLDYRLMLFLRPSLTFRPSVSFSGGAKAVPVPISKTLCGQDNTHRLHFINDLVNS